MRKMESEKLEALTRELVHAYFVERDYPQLLRYISPQISWFGTGAEEVCVCIEEAIKYLEQEQQMYQGSFQVSREEYHATLYADNFACVMAQLDVTADPASGYYVNIPVRFSIVCVRSGKQWKVCHIHNSVPYHAQGDASFFDREAAEADYGRMKEMAIAVAEEYVKESEQDDELENEVIECALKAKLMEVFDDPQTIQTAIAVFGSYIDEHKALRRAQQVAGMRRAKRLGRRPIDPPENFDDVYGRYLAGGLSRRAAAKELGVSPETFGRFCEERQPSAVK